MLVWKEGWNHGNKDCERREMTQMTLSLANCLRIIPPINHMLRQISLYHLMLLYSASC
uniref:Uncharacterized protein n=1 Tax=Rhizophora mucronata TaxID=61149 RepID=A0A2P2MAC7_RHIMU